MIVGVPDERMVMVSIAGLDKAEVLKALYDGSRAQGMSFLGVPRGGVSIQECRDVLAAGQTYFDYWMGHVLKVDLSGDEFDPYLYDRDCGPGAAAVAIERVRSA
jgi:hypothetical protein